MGPAWGREPASSSLGRFRFGGSSCASDGPEAPGPNPRDSEAVNQVQLPIFRWYMDQTMSLEE